MLKYFYIKFKFFSKNLREGKALKKGLLLKNSEMKKTTIPLDRKLEDLPSSIFHKEDFGTVADPFSRKTEPEKCVSPFDFDRF